jgi:thiamine biosynthesis protein ThiS
MAGTIKVNDREIPWREGITVAEALKACNYLFPLVIVSIDGRHVAREDYATTVVPENATVQVVHLLSGG